MIVYDVARLIRERVPDAAQGEGKSWCQNGAMSEEFNLWALIRVSYRGFD